MWKNGGTPELKTAAAQGSSAEVTALCRRKCEPNTATHIEQECLIGQFMLFLGPIQEKRLKTAPLCGHSPHASKTSTFATLTYLNVRQKALTSYRIPFIITNCRDQDILIWICVPNHGGQSPRTRSGGCVALPTLYSPEEIAERLKVSRRSVYHWLNSGKLTGLKAGQYWRVTEEDLIGFMKHEKPTPKGGQQTGL